MEAAPCVPLTGSNPGGKASESNKALLFPLRVALALDHRRCQIILMHGVTQAQQIHITGVKLIPARSGLVQPAADFRLNVKLRQTVLGRGQGPNDPWAWALQGFGGLTSLTPPPACL